MIERRWIVRCDREGCAETLVVPPPDFGGEDLKWEAGIYAADCGWDVAPNRRESYCPAHHTPTPSDGDAVTTEGA